MPISVLRGAFLQSARDTLIGRLRVSLSVRWLIIFVRTSLRRLSCRATPRRRNRPIRRRSPEIRASPTFDDGRRLSSAADFRTRFRRTSTRPVVGIVRFAGVQTYDWSIRFVVARRCFVDCSPVGRMSTDVSSAIKRRPDQSVSSTTDGDLPAVPESILIICHSPSDVRSLVHGHVDDCAVVPFLFVRLPAFVSNRSSHVWIWSYIVYNVYWSTTTVPTFTQCLFIFHCAVYRDHVR